MQYVGDGFSQPIVMDAGGAGGGGLGANTAELGITSRAGHGAYTPPYASNGNGPLGEHFCMFDGPTDNPTGYHYLCLDPNAQGGGLLDFGAAAGALQLPLAFIYNGTTYNFPFAAGGIVGPGTTTAGDIAIWNNTTGTLLKDVAVLPTINGGTGTANPAGIPEFNGVSAPTFINPGSGVATAIGVNTNASGGMTLVNGSPTIGDCLRWSSTGVQDAGGACSGGGGMIYPGAGVAVSTGSAWGTSINLGTGVSPALGVNTNASTGIVLANNSPTLVPGHCLQWSSTGVQDAGGACTTGGGGGTVSSGSTNNLAYYSTAGTTVTGLATANNGVLVTSSGVAPSISTTLPSGLTAPSFTVTTTFTATGLVTNADLVYSSTTVNGQSCTLGSTCTVAAAAGTLTGATLASGVTGSSLTSAAGGAFGTGAYATAYVLPTATNSVLGGVKPDGTTLANTSGAINVNLSHANTWLATQTFPSASITLAELATQTANTVLANATAGAASPTAVSMPSCSAGSSALTWTTSTGFGCNTITSGGLTNVYDASSCAVSTTTSSGDEASCVQGFINTANTAGGGVVWMGVGYINLKSQVTVKSGVTLQCANNGSVFDSNTMAYGGKGSVFAVLWGSGSVAYTNAAILLDYDSGVRNCGFWYPSQSAASASPTVYGPTIALFTSNGTIGNVNQTIADNFFANSYESMGLAGSYASSGVGRLHVQRNNGSCIYACYYINFIVDWTTIDHNHWNSGALWNADSSPSSHLRGWVALNGFVAYVQHSDWLLFDNEQAWGYNQGIGEDFATACCGSFTDNGPVTLANSQFDGVDTAMIVNTGTAQDNRMSNNTLTDFIVTGSVGGYAYATTSGATTTTVTMIGNHQFGPAGGFYTNLGTTTRAVIQGNTSDVTGGSASGVALGAGTSAIVIGNDMHGYTNAVNVGTVTNVVNQYNVVY